MKIPYQLVMACSVDHRYANMAAAVARGLPRIQPKPIGDGTLHVACYGPSLADTWQSLGRPLISMSGATRWLADRGVIADYHIDMDPRAHKVYDLTPPVPGVRYLMASVCPPGTWDLLKDEQVTLWHALSDKTTPDWICENDPEQVVVWTGSTVGLAALQVGGLLGFRKFEIHGMDASLRGDVRHAGPHHDKPQKRRVTWDAAGKTWHSTQIMANAAAETINTISQYPIVCVFHGEGLTQALVREAKLPNACCVDEPHVNAVRGARLSVLVGSPPVENAADVWDLIGYASPNPAWLAELQVAFAIADERRRFAAFNTGSISLETGLLLRGLCEWRKPRAIVEIGTFIGKSTVSMKASETIYTCDKDNDCVPRTSTIRTHPRTTSTEMLRKLAADGVEADLFFFDGRLSDEDAELVVKISSKNAVYAFDDFNPGGKGYVNVEKLQPRVGRRYAFVGPHPSFGERTSLAVLVPTEAAA